MMLLIAPISIFALALYAYGAGLHKPFVADDYQWLVNVRGLSFGAALRAAFDPGAQQHFYRPLVWLALWAQMQLFGSDPLGYHCVSLALHLLNAALLGWLCWRLSQRPGDEETRRPEDKPLEPQSSLLLVSLSVLSAGIVALHPAIFEAVVWVSAQSELLAAALLLALLHVGLGQGTGDRGQRTEDRGQRANTRFAALRLVSRALVASLPAAALLALALLTKESAVIGLPLLVLFGGLTPDAQRPTPNQSPITNHQSPITNLLSYLLPTLATGAYLVLQLLVERKNYLVQQGGYGVGWHILLNPLRSLALIVAPLPSTEHAEAAWLVPLGALVLVGFTIYDLRFTIEDRSSQSKIQILKAKTTPVLALALALLPTAPFRSPPDSRYLYLPVLFAALLLGVRGQGSGVRGQGSGSRGQGAEGRKPFVALWFLALAACGVLLGYGAAEVRAREGRWAAAGGAGGSLWRVAGEACAAKLTKRVVVVEPPLLAAHAQAIVALACGDETQPVIVSRADVDGAVKRRTVVISFPEGSAVVERRR